MPTKLIRSIYNVTPEMQGGVITIGNFDGVHLGHQKLITKVVEKAKGLEIPSIAVTFEPHPFEYFDKELSIPRLTRLREKFYWLSQLGLDYVIILPFNQSLADQTASDFVSGILYDTLYPVHIIVGDDFKFGYKRQGDFALLSQMGSELGFAVEAMPTVALAGERVSSTRIRKALQAGNLELASFLLGRPYSMQGHIRPGNQLGRELGFPTANIFLHRKLTPVMGVFTVYVRGISEKPLPGVANVGTRPTVDGTRCLLEVHLLDFNQDIYGRYVEVEFCEKLRDEVRYETLDLLKEQIAKDVIAAKNYFATKQSS